MPEADKQGANDHADRLNETPVTGTQHPVFCTFAFQRLWIAATYQSVAANRLPAGLACPNHYSGGPLKRQPSNDID